MSSAWRALRCADLESVAVAGVGSKLQLRMRAAAGAAALRNVTWNRGVHPNVIAHFVIAEGVARALLDAEGAEVGQLTCAVTALAALQEIDAGLAAPAPVRGRAGPLKCRALLSWTFLSSSL